MLRTNFSLLIILLVLSQRVHCQTPQVHLLDLESSIAIAKSSSFDMLILNQDLKISEFTLKSTTSRYKTHIDLELNTPNYTETIRQFEDSTGITFYPVKRANYGGFLTLNQPLPTDGKVFIRSGFSSTSDYFADTRWTRLNTLVQLVQPVDAFFGHNELKMSLKQARLDYERTQKRLKREELNLVYRVSSNFFNLVSAQKRVELALLNLERQQEAFEIAKNKYKAGLIREVDALQMEVDLAEAQNDYDQKVTHMASASNIFKKQLGIALADSIVISNAIAYVPVEVELEKALKYAMANRQEIREQEIQIELTELNLKTQKARGRISGDINASYDLIGVNGVPSSASFSSSLENVWGDLQQRPGNFAIGLSINIPILDWGENRAKVNAIEARMKQNIYRQEEQMRDIELEIINLVATFKSSMKRLQLLERNLIVAEKSFKITLSRYSDGDIDSQALALERERLNNAYLSHLSAYIDYELKLTDLMRNTFFDFKKQMPVN